MSVEEIERIASELINDDNISVCRDTGIMKVWDQDGRQDSRNTKRAWNDKWDDRRNAERNNRHEEDQYRYSEKQSAWNTDLDDSSADDNDKYFRVK